MNEKELTINSPSGAKLAATLATPDNPAPGEPIVIMAHGFTTTRNNSTNTTLVPRLADLGIATLRFDFFGHGESTGDFAESTLTKGKQDILACINYVRTKLAYDNVSLFGSSYGGNTAIMAASEVSQPLKSLFLKAPVTNWRKRDDEEYNPQLLKDWKEKGYRMVEHSKLGETRLNYGFYEDEVNNNGWEAAKKITCPTLIIHGDADSVVPIEHTRYALTLFKNAKLIELPGVDHWFAEDGAFERMVDETANFFSRELL